MRKLKKIFGGILIAAMLAGCSDYLSTFLPIENTEETTQNENPTTPNSPENPNTPENPDTPTETKYTVTFDKNAEEADGATECVSGKANETVTLTANGFSRAGYVFSAWNTKADGSGTTYANSASLVLTENLTLYAIWEAIPPNSFVVTFNTAGGSAVSEKVVTDGEKASEPTAPTKTDYTFAGWHTSTDGGETLSETAFSFDTAITASITLYAKWTANTNTPYQVQHFKQNIENDEYTIVSDDTENLTGVTGGQTTASEKSYDGFEVKDFSQAQIAADGSTVVKIYYNRKIITLTFKSGGENWDDGTSATTDKTVSGKYGVAVNAPTLPTKAGYGSAWDKTVQATFTSDETYTAQYAEGQVNYTVKHLQQNADDDSYSEVASETLSGTTGAQTAAEAKSYEHFTAQSFTQKAISADGSTLVEIKYNRETVTISFDSDGGSAVASISGRYGATYTKPENPTKQGYTFSKWSTDLPDTLVNLSVTALWLPNTDTPYKVEHYQQNVSGSDYTISDTENLTGTTDSNTNASEKSYDGFTTKSFSQETIAADGSTVVKIYYDRKTVTYTFEANGGNWNGSVANKEISGLYGATVTAPANPTRTDYTFAGWNTNIPTQFGVISGESFSLAKTFTATWTANTLSPTVTLESVSTDASLSITESGGTLTATGGFANYRWKIDGTMAQNGTTNTYTPNTSALEAGYHNITLAVTDANGGIWSATAVITVRK